MLNKAEKDLPILFLDTELKLLYFFFAAAILLVISDILWFKEGYLFYAYFIIGIPQFVGSIIHWLDKRLRTTFLTLYSILTYPIWFLIILLLITSYLVPNGPDRFLLFISMIVGIIALFITPVLAAIYCVVYQKKLNTWKNNPELRA